MIRHKDTGSDELRKLFKQKKILFGGNSKLGIYGTLHCKSGKRMKINNRIFFSSQEEAIKNGYRPCGNCMKKEYSAWKNKPR